MNRASRRLSTSVAALAFALVLVACTIGTQAPSEAAGPSHPQGAQGGSLPAGPALPTAVETTRITRDLPEVVVLGRYGTRTSATLAVRAAGTDLRYTWQQHPASGSTWRTIRGAGKRSYVASAARWPRGTRFRVVVSGRLGRDVSSTARLRVLLPTATPAKDAEEAFGLSGLTQGVDLSAYQYSPSGRVRPAAVADWAGEGGFAILRTGSGARPVRVAYTDACTWRTRRTGSVPATRDCAYERLADQATSAGLRLGHYWFNGWISSIDTTRRELFANGFTPERSAAKYVAWLKRDGNYARSSTDPLVLDIEAGSTWTKKSDGRTYRLKLRAWRPAEAAAFLAEVERLLKADGHAANLYVYMSANATRKRAADGSYAWADVAARARLWVAGWGTNNGRIPEAQPEVGPWADHGGWSIWQYTSNARIAADGISSGIDGDIARADAWTPRG